MIILLIASLFILSIIVIVLIIKLNWKSAVSLFLIPFLVFNIGFGWYTINKLWGQARQGKPEPHLQVVDVIVDKPWVYLLVKDKDKQYIFHKIPYNKETEKQAAKAQKQLKKGQKIFIDETKNKNLEQQTHFEWYVWRHEQSLPKK